MTYYISWLCTIVLPDQSEMGFLIILLTDERKIQFYYSLIRHIALQVVQTTLNYCHI